MIRVLATILLITLITSCVTVTRIWPPPKKNKDFTEAESKSKNNINVNNDNSNSPSLIEGE